MPLSATQRELCERVRTFVTERIVPLEESLDPDESELDAETLAPLIAETRALRLRRQA